MKTKVVEKRWLKSFSDKYFTLESKIEKNGHVIEGWLKDDVVCPLLDWADRPVLVAQNRPRSTPFSPRQVERSGD